jgi:hypothetical protein
MGRAMKPADLLLLALFGSSAHAQTSAEFSLHAMAPATVVWGQTFEITVKSTHNERLAACAFQLSVSGSAAAVLVQRAVAAPLTYLSSAPADPLADGLPLQFTGPDSLTEVFIALDSADPPGNPLDGVAPGALVPLATYTLLPARAGTLTLTLTGPQAAETQSTPGGRLFDQAGISPASGEVSFSIIGGPDVNGDGRVDLRDFARLQGCFGQVPAGSCAGADADADGDIDNADVAFVQHCLAGPAVAPSCSPSGRTGGAP